MIALSPGGHERSVGGLRDGINQIPPACWSTVLVVGSTLLVPRTPQLVSGSRGRG
jgi:hypothetical protein